MSKALVGQLRIHSALHAAVRDAEEDTSRLALNGKIAALRMCSVVLGKGRWYGGIALRFATWSRRAAAGHHKKLMAELIDTKDHHEVFMLMRAV